MIAYIDIPIGVSGNMLLGALLDAGLPPATLQAIFDAIHLPELSFEIQPLQKNGIVATHVEIIVPDQQSHRRLREIKQILRNSDLSQRVREQSLKVFQRLAQAEARVHGVNEEEVHFHEVGALDAIADIVGVVAGFEALGVNEIHASPIPLSHGRVQTAHGQLPVPPPAVLALLEGYPVRGIDIEGETVTPTGAALVTTLAHTFGPPPAMLLQHVGQGAGSRDFPIPNIVRLLLGQAQREEEQHPAESEPLLLLETNIDDMNPEWLGPLLDDLLSRGALDAWFTPIQMKKNRPALQLSLLCPLTSASSLRAYLFAQTTTLGIRQQLVERYALPRCRKKVETVYGTIHIKLAEFAPGQWKAAPEYEDCRAAARAHKTSLMDIYAAALAAWEK
ncbi:MAG: nickel pincer cofactor biosynthesis protein LarC, partial [Chloroflexi bacterium]|nr:nickel pincer cofactor biosynthesis protein LarC [Chloroflexota bacterium]